MPMTGESVQRTLRVDTATSRGNRKIGLAITADYLSTTSDITNITMLVSTLWDLNRTLVSINTFKVNFLHQTPLFAG